MNERIKKIRLSNGKTQLQFADDLGLTRNYIAMIEIGQREPSERTISDICREFNVRREWLETGEGPMRLPEPEEDLDYINRLLADDDADTVRFIKKFLRAYNDLSPADQKVIDNLIHTLTNQK